MPEEKPAPLAELFGAMRDEYLQLYDIEAMLDAKPSQPPWLF